MRTLSYSSDKKKESCHHKIWQKAVIIVQLLDQTMQFSEVSEFDKLL